MNAFRSISRTLSLLIVGTLFLTVILSCAAPATEPAAGDDDNDAAADSASPLAATSWILHTIEGQDALPIAPATANFGDNIVQGVATCNTYSTTYSATGDTINIAPPTINAIFCPAALTQQELAFVSALETAAVYEIVDGVLILRDEASNELATLVAAPTTVSDTAWRATGYLNSKGGMVTVIEGSVITAAFGTDDSLTGFGGCNDYTGTYRVEGETIKVAPAATTKKACSDPSGVMDQESDYLAALELAATFDLQGARLEFRDGENKQVVTFVYDTRQ
ncbi:MAG: META domain-containing protein [Chloroflexota bacterium]|nr:META domain-containing protein [Chloroflexota bacterium]